MWTDIVEQYQRREGWVSQYADELALVETRRQDVVEAEVGAPQAVLRCCSVCRISLTPFLVACRQSVRAAGYVVRGEPMW